MARVRRQNDAPRGLDESILAFTRSLVIFSNDGAPSTPLRGMRDRLAEAARTIAVAYEDRRAAIQRLDRELRELEESYLATSRALGFVVDTLESCGDDDPRGVRVAVTLASTVDASLGDAPSLRAAALLRDVGTVAIPPRVIAKSGPLSHDEWELVRTHPSTGALIVRGVDFLEEAAPVVEAHHERWDGSGYPNGLAGEDIPLAARVLGVADAFDAMTSDRPYRRAIPHDRALDEMRRHAGAQFDPAIVEALVGVVEGGVIELEPAPASASR